MSVYPGKIKLPADIFCNLPSPQIAQTVARKTFLPDSCAEWLKNVSTSKKGANSAGPVVSDDRGGSGHAANYY